MPTKTSKAESKAHSAKRLAFSLQIAAGEADVPPVRKLRQWARAALVARAQVTVRVVGRREGRSLNRRYRGRDYATNVLTFTYAKKPVVCGDIALCAPVIRQEAQMQAKALDAHYAHLLVHGMLHLQGHDHRFGREAKCMEAREVAIMRRLGYPNPYTVHSA